MAKTAKIPKADSQDRLQQAIQQMADITVQFESGIEKIAVYRQETQELLEANRQACADEMNEIRQILSEFNQNADHLNEALTPMGQARWREQEEETRKRERESSEQMLLSTKEFSAATKKVTERLDQVAMHAANRITDATSSFRVDDFARIADEKLDEVGKITHKSELKILRTAKRLLVEKIGIAVLVAFVTATFTGYYVSGQWPWEAHETILAERNAGQVLMHAWPSLTQNERHRIRSPAIS